MAFPANTASIDDGRKIWKLSDMDLKSYSRWYDYSRARDEMFLATDTSWAPWYVVHSDNKRRARLNILTHILSKIPYKDLKRPKVELPKRQHRGDYKDTDYPFQDDSGGLLSRCGPGAPWRKAYHGVKPSRRLDSARRHAAARSASSHLTPRWREMDSNFRFRARRNREILVSRRSSTDLVWLRPPEGLGALAPRVEEFGDVGSCYLLLTINKGTV